MTPTKDLETIKQLLYANHVEKKDLLSIKDRLVLLTIEVNGRLKHYK